MHRGPYGGSSFEVSYALHDAHGFDEKGHPTPSEDGLLVHWARLFGCESMESLKKWFKGFWKLLGSDGFAVWEIECGQVWRGSRQVAFDSRHVISSRCFPINRQGRVTIV